MLTYAERMLKNIGVNAGGALKSFSGLTKTGKASYKVVAKNDEIAPPVVGTAEATESNVRKWASNVDTDIKSVSITNTSADGAYQTVRKIVVISADLVNDMLACGACSETKKTSKPQTKPHTDERGIEEALQTANGAK